MRILFLTFILSFFAAPLIAGGQIDSLKNAYSSTSDDEEKAILLRDISRYYLDLNTDSSLFYGFEGLVLSERLSYDRGIAVNAASVGDNYVRLDSLEKARHFYSLCVEAFEKSGTDQKTQVNALLILGNIYFVTNNFPEALNAYQQGMKICEDNGYDETLAHLHNNIGSLYLEMDNLVNALENTKAAYEGFTKINLEFNAAKSLGNLAIVYKRLNEFDQALENLDNALEIFNNIDDKENIAEANRIKGLIYSDKKDYEKALVFFNNAINIVNQEGFHSQAPRSIILSTLYMNMAQNKSQLNQDQEAIEFAQKSLEISLPNKYLKTMAEDYLILNQVYEKNHSIENAYKYLKLYKAYSDSVMNENAIEKITRLQLEYEFAKKISERELAQSIKDAEQLRQEYLYIITIVLVISIAILGFLLFLYQKNKTRQARLKRENLELEQKNLNQKLDLNKKELEFKNKELTTNIMYTAKKVGMITNIAKELQKSKSGFKSENRDIIDNVIRQLENASSEESWKEFEIRFQDVHNEFYDNLTKALPDLSPNEKKLCAFLKLNMTTKDISAITHQSVKSITMARYRLRQKLNLERDDNLISFLAKL